VELGYVIWYAASWTIMVSGIDSRWVKDTFFSTCWDCV